MIYRIKESLELRLNLFYITLQGLYWMIVCCTISLGSAYLSNRGYSTVGIGALFALAYLFASVLQQLISVETDRSTSINVVDVLAVLGGLLVINQFFAMGTDSKSFGTGFTFMLGAMIATIIQPFLNALNFHIERYDIKMNYGVARASGSFFFFIMSLIAGNLMKTVSEKAAPALGLIVSILFVANIIWIYKELKSTGKNPKKDFDPFENSTSSNDSFDVNSIKNFIESYKMFFIFLIGLMGFYFGHVLINNFLYQITANVGGDEADTGGLLAMQAIVELPAMIFFTWLKDRFGSKLLLSVSAVFYFVKIFATTIATSVGMLYFSMLFQALAFAIFIPASVHFVDEIMSKKDAVKGQAFVTIAMTLSNLLSSLIGGVLIRLFGVTLSLWFGTVVTICGVVVSIYGLVKIKEK
ncbi:MFS transporter [Pseudobutyrivibrio ruminis]|uniref:MFS transporter n=1 Tax=Pseudobutyrivibrio ruminis TaxID=46206 RepID=UPI00040BCADD|nr:MFS transporter [Pseudobutyrivibrio ruminis]